MQCFYNIVGIITFCLLWRLVQLSAQMIWSVSAQICLLQERAVLQVPLCHPWHWSVLPSVASESCSPMEMNFLRKVGTSQCQHARETQIHPTRVCKEISLGRESARAHPFRNAALLQTRFWVDRFFVVFLCLFLVLQSTGVSHSIEGVTGITWL